jgi:hypothetical protein
VNWQTRFAILTFLIIIITIDRGRGRSLVFDALAL